MTSSSYSEAACRYEELVDQVLAFISNSSNSFQRSVSNEQQFNQLALSLFSYQFQFNDIYQSFCRQQGKTPRMVKSWREIPAVPLQAFKSSTLSCTVPQKAEAVFMTSGTTSPEQRGKHYHASLRLYDASMLAAFKHYMLESGSKQSMVLLFPDKQQLPNSSLAHYLHLAKENFGSPHSAYAMNKYGIDPEKAISLLESAEQKKIPLLLLGATFGFVQLIDQLRQQGRSFTLPAGSKLMDTGGTKGRSREIEQELLYKECTELLGIPRSRCTNMYGMTELSSQFYETSHSKPGQKYGPPWIATRVIDPITGQELPIGEKGVLVHCDLANVNAVTTILTDDIGYMTEDGGFVLAGRAQGAAAKGCSLVMEEYEASASSR